MDSFADDYPAAHSMDAHWFAVDAEGHVALFHSTESGAVPSGLHGDDPYAFGEQLAPLLPRVEVIHDLAGRRRPAPGRLDGIEHVFFDAEWPVVMFLDSLDPVQADIDAGRAVVARATEGHAVLWPTLPAATRTRLHEAGVCKGCHHSWYEFSDESALHALGRRGFFEYRHPMENWISQSYGRQSIPAAPVHIDQLPPEVRQRLKHKRFALRFSDTLQIQPVEHGPCESWEAAYLDVTGHHIRPLPGGAGNYTEFYDEYRKYLNQPPGDSWYTIEPPPGADEGQSA